jgi:hypothetical protein
MKTVLKTILSAGVFFNGFLGIATLQAAALLKEEMTQEKERGATISAFRREVLARDSQRQLLQLRLAGGRLTPINFNINLGAHQAALLPGAAPQTSPAQGSEQPAFSVELLMMDDISMENWTPGQGQEAEGVSAPVTTLDTAQLPTLTEIPATQQQSSSAVPAQAAQAAPAAAAAQSAQVPLEQSQVRNTSPHVRVVINPRKIQVVAKEGVLPAEVKEALAQTPAARAYARYLAAAELAASAGQTPRYAPAPPLAAPAAVAAAALPASPKKESCCSCNNSCNFFFCNGCPCSYSNTSDNKVAPQ